jgi:hypothetical protein
MNAVDPKRSEGVEPGASSSILATLREIATDAIRYWEPRRVLYNAILTAIVIGHFVAEWPASREVISLENVLGLFVLAVLANLCYCAAYIVDFIAQLSEFRGLWRRWRWILLAIGIAFAATLTQLIAADIFNPAD